MKIIGSAGSLFCLEEAVHFREQGFFNLSKINRDFSVSALNQNADTAKVFILDLYILIETSVFQCAGADMEPLMIFRITDFLRAGDCDWKPECGIGRFQRDCVTVNRAGMKSLRVIQEAIGSGQPGQYFQYECVL